MTNSSSTRGSPSDRQLHREPTPAGASRRCKGLVLYTVHLHAPSSHQETEDLASSWRGQSYLKGSDHVDPSNGFEVSQ